MQHYFKKIICYLFKFDNLEAELGDMGGSDLPFSRKIKGPICKWHVKGSSGALGPGLNSGTEGCLST